MICDDVSAIMFEAMVAEPLVCTDLGSCLTALQARKEETIAKFAQKKEAVKLRLPELIALADMINPKVDSQDSKKATIDPIQVMHEEENMITQIMNTLARHL